MTEPSPSQPSDEVDQVRRRLLILGGRYVAPAVLATLMFGQTAYAASCSPPANCTPTQIPCAPTQPCNPATK